MGGDRDWSQGVLIVVRIMDGKDIDGVWGTWIGSEGY